MGEYVLPLQGVVAGFQNEDTERKIEFIEKLHNLGVANYVPLPQLVVVGDQSSGKSSVLQAITKLPFPVSDRMCTRFATEVALHHSSDPTSMSISIRIGTHIGDYLFTDAHREQMLNWKPEKMTDIDNMDPTEFAELFAHLLKEGSKIILGGEGDTEILSDATLNITIRGPKQSDLIIIDIPGLVANGHPAHETARALVKRYIKNPRSIILAIAHPSDPGTQQVFQILKNIDKKEHRVIGVITKCDRKQIGAENWILETIKNQRGPRNQHFLDQGWFGLRNRLPSEVNTSNDVRDNLEARFFDEGVWTQLHRSKLGISNLITALQKMHNNHITTSIPELVPEIEKQLALCKSKLDQLGSSRETKQSQLNCMVKLATNFEKMSTYAIDGHYDNLPDNPEIKLRKIVHESLESFENQMLQQFNLLITDKDIQLNSAEESSWDTDIFNIDIYKEIGQVIHDNRGREAPGEANPSVKCLLWKSKTADWAAAATVAVNELVRSISVAVDVIFKHVCTDEELRQNVQPWLSKYLIQVSRDSLTELSKIVNDERSGLIWTLNPDYLSKIQEYSDARVRIMTEEMLYHIPRDPERANQTRKAKAKEKVEAWISKRKDISAIFDTYDRLAAYYEVAMNRFIDNVGHQVIERHLLGPNSPLKIFRAEYVVRTLQEDEEELKKLAGENEAKVAERKKLTEGKAKLEEALNMAKMYGFV